MASARARWGMITLDELEMTGGRREALTGHIEEVYGISLAKAQAQVEAWRGEQREPAAA
ncbi:MAG TPA: general stress protein CsbD [Burkholderiales bacterium]|nr:general stress protein CsbD [Burkholderiales bacterium]